jgi:hypothetical protein
MQQVQPSARPGNRRFVRKIPLALGLHFSVVGGRTMSARSKMCTLLCVLAMPLLACKLGNKVGAQPTAGKSCDKDGSNVCQDQATQLVCQGGIWRSFPCGGPLGCATSGDKTTCDISGNYSGNLCSVATNASATCSGKRSMVTCEEGKIATRDCRGKRGCYDEAGAAKCDQSIAESGTACSSEGAWACSVDQKYQLVCKNSEWVQNAACRGPDSCSEKKDDKGKPMLWCDQRLAYSGDTCFTAGQRACSHDGRVMLECKNGKFAHYWSCSGSPCKILANGNLDCNSY